MSMVILVAFVSYAIYSRETIGTLLNFSRQKP